MRRRALSILLALTTLVGIAVLGPEIARAHVSDRAAPVAARPNVIVIMADDMRQDEVRYMPHLRSLLANRGVEFMNSYSPYPLCCPARASFLSGQYAHNHGVFSNHTPFGFSAMDDSYTVATAMQQAGYNTAFLGKYLNNYGKVKSRVTGRMSTRYVPAGWTYWQGGLSHSDKLGIKGDVYNYRDTSYNLNGAVVESKGRYQTNVIGAAGRRVVKRFSTSAKPFFMWLSFVAPHKGGPHESDDPKLPTPNRPRSVWGMFDKVITKAPGLSRSGASEPDVEDKPRFIQRRPEPGRAKARAIRAVARQRAESLTILDRQIGNLVTTLRKTGELSNTVLMFTSDNGYFLGEHRIPTGKILNYEPALRVPLIMAGPGIPAGQRRYDPISTVDLTATITDLGGASSRMAARRIPDGFSKVSVLENGDKGWTHAQLTESVRGGLQNWDKGPGFGMRSQIGIRSGRYQYTRNAGDVTELYDLLRDPNELHNVAGQAEYAGVLDEFASLWGRLKDCVGSGCRLRLPDDLAETPSQIRAETESEFAGVLRRTGMPWR